MANHQHTSGIQDSREQHCPLPLVVFLPAMRLTCLTRGEGFFFLCFFLKDVCVRGDEASLSLSATSCVTADSNKPAVARKSVSSKPVA